MTTEDRELLDLLNFELRFLEEGGYGRLACHQDFSGLYQLPEF